MQPFPHAAAARTDPRPPSAAERAARPAPPLTPPPLLDGPTAASRAAVMAAFVAPNAQQAVGQGPQWQCTWQTCLDICLDIFLLNLCKPPRPSAFTPTQTYAIRIVQLQAHPLPRALTPSRAAILQYGISLQGFHGRPRHQAQRAGLRSEVVVTMVCAYCLR